MPGRTLKENRFPLARLCRSLLLYLDPVDKRMKLPSIPDRVTPPCRGISLAGPNLPGSTIQGSSCFCRSLVLPCSGGVSNHN